jgi:hypothetical protein
VTLLASGHASFETNGQIAIADSIKDCDDLLLVRVCHFHFACCGHAAYLCGAVL